MFWFFDLGGTISLKGNYRAYHAIIADMRARHATEHDWFVGHIVTPYFYLYGVANVVFFALLLGADLLFHGAPWSRFVTSLIILAGIVFRHASVRSGAYTRYRDRKLSLMAAG